jgi:hypothetical protein
MESQHFFVGNVPLLEVGEPDAMIWQTTNGTIFMQNTQPGDIAASLLCQDIVSAALNWFNSAPAYYGHWSSQENRSSIYH